MALFPMTRIKWDFTAIKIVVDEKSYKPLKGNSIFKLLSKTRQTCQQ